MLVLGRKAREAILVYSKETNELVAKIIVTNAEGVRIVRLGLHFSDELGIARTEQTFFDGMSHTEIMAIPLGTIVQFRNRTRETAK